MNDADVKRINLSEIEYVMISGVWHYCEKLQIFGEETMSFNCGESCVIVDNKSVQALSVGRPIIAIQG